MAGIMAPLTAGAFFLGGQKQGAFANEIERQKLELAQRQAAVAGRRLVQNQDGTWKIVDLAAPDAVGQTVGTPEDFAQHLQTMLSSGVVPKNFQGLVQQALTSNDRDLQSDVYQSIRKLITAPIKEASGAGKDPVVLDQAMANNPNLTDRSQVSNSQYLDAWKQIQQYKSGLIEGRTPPQIVQITNPDPVSGQNVTQAYRVPKRAGDASQIVAGPAPAPSGGETSLTGRKTSAQQQQAITGMLTAEQDGAKLLDMADVIKDKGPGWLAAQHSLYSKYTNPYGVRGQADPLYTQYIQMIGQVKSELMSASTAGGSRSIQLIEKLEPHIPSETDPPWLVADKIRGFQNGRFQSLRNAILTPSAIPAASKSGMSKADTLKEKGYVALPDGMYYNPTTNKYDDGK